MIDFGILKALLKIVKYRKRDKMSIDIFYLIKIVKALKVKFQSALEYVGDPLSRLTKKKITGQSESLKSIIFVVATYDPM